jgi:hypothetical protein
VIFAVLREWHYPVLAPFTRNLERHLFEVNIFPAKTETFPSPKTSIEKNQRHVPRPPHICSLGFEGEEASDMTFRKRPDNCLFFLQLGDFEILPVPLSEALMTRR